MMDAIIERCAGLDIHQATVVACVLIGGAGRKPHKEIQTFSTMTQDLEAMRDWLKGGDVPVNVANRRWALLLLSR
jgi:transposase